MAVNRHRSRQVTMVRLDIHKAQVWQSTGTMTHTQQSLNTHMAYVWQLFRHTEGSTEIIKGAEMVVNCQHTLLIK